MICNVGRFCCALCGQLVAIHPGNLDVGDHYFYAAVRQKVFQRAGTACLCGYIPPRSLVWPWLFDFAASVVGLSPLFSGRLGVCDRVRQLSCTRQVPSRDLTKPYSLAAAALPKISGWTAGLTPLRLPAPQTRRARRPCRCHPSRSQKRHRERPERGRLRSRRTPSFCSFLAPLVANAVVSTRTLSRLNSGRPRLT
jgi:hypothetical protein